jgi:hypothetical protein
MNWIFSLDVQDWLATDGFNDLLGGGCFLFILRDEPFWKVLCESFVLRGPSQLSFTSFSCDLFSLVLDVASSSIEEQCGRQCMPGLKVDWTSAGPSSEKPTWTCWFALQKSSKRMPMNHKLKYFSLSEVLPKCPGHFFSSNDSTTGNCLPI